MHATIQERALHCFQRVATSGKEDVGQSYGMAAALTPYSCRNEVIDLLVKVRPTSSRTLFSHRLDGSSFQYQLGIPQ